LDKPGKGKKGGTNTTGHLREGDPKGWETLQRGWVSGRIVKDTVKGKGFLGIKGCGQKKGVDGAGANLNFKQERREGAKQKRKGGCRKGGRYHRQWGDFCATKAGGTISSCFDAGEKKKKKRVKKNYPTKRQKKRRGTHFESNHHPRPVHGSKAFPRNESEERNNPRYRGGRKKRERWGEIKYLFQKHHTLQTKTGKSETVTEIWRERNERANYGRCGKT